jgi:hypothetical protein
MIKLDFGVETQIIHSGYDRKTCWVQTRGGVLPPNQAVITTQKLRISGSDIFYGINTLHSEDFGRTWTVPQPQPGLMRRRNPDGTEDCPCDGTPTWHAQSGKLLLTGHLAQYRDDNLVHGLRSRSTYFSVYDEKTRLFSDWRTLSLPPDDPACFNSGAGCVQRFDLPDGDILLPTYFRPKDDTTGCYKGSVMRCGFDGTMLVFKERGPDVTCPEPRGFCEPSLTWFGGRYFLTLRNDVRGYVAAGENGLRFGPPKPWMFDDGVEIGNYNTQQHWVTHSEGLFLVYTRRGANNDHVFRHRAPLFMARVDPERLCLIRSSERVVVPERGARLGNFGICTASPEETWVVVSEWMQTTGPDNHDCTKCERYGSDNALFVSRLRWNPPNGSTRRSEP